VVKEEPVLSNEQLKANYPDATVTLKVDRDHAELCIHTPNEKVNKLSRSAFVELHEHFVFLKAKSEEIKTVLIYSDKPDMFLAGADISEIEAMTTQEDALSLVEKAQEVFQELAELPQITCVAIDGICFGGGLELSLAAKYRLASDSASTKLGLPEVQLGVIPGAGGTQRLPKVVGLVNAITMITSGAPVDAKKALKLGLVSDVIPVENLLSEARKFLKDKIYLRVPQKEPFLQWMVDGTPLKKLIYRQARAAVLEKSKGFYPAPLKALEVIEQTFNKTDIRTGLKIEAQAFAELAISPIAKNLIGLFYGTEELKKERGVGAMEAPDFRPAKLQRLGVIGAGIMGGGIAAVAAQKGVSVRMKDVSNESILHGLKTAHDLFTKDFKRRKITKAEYKKRIYKISPTLTWTGFEHLPIVIEAVVEKLEVKKAVIAELESRLPEYAIIASNTSSLSITEMAKSAKRPGQIVGMHFFNPVPKMPLVEVIRGERSDAKSIIQTVAFGRQLGKTVIVVKDRPGFLVNRILMPFLIEAGHLREEGYNISQIDKAATTFGMPMGPFRLLDEIGLDTGAKVADVIASAFPHMKVLPMINDMVTKGYLGKKNSRGFYHYDSTGKVISVRSEFQRDPKDASDATHQMIQDRLILPMVTEALMALEEGVVATVRDLDLGLIFGIGFPPFRGGLLKWVSDCGEQKILDRMNAVHNATKGRLIVPASLTNRIQAGQKFYN
jgi:3-hydroxyacyl-CoA dehydrogenase/enoyl-CoA hydratase/3-hydroxybutyryl-CoA epimerase